uniref:Uncharacterized protein n=1 Tax=Glossina palpalis gambiensis TaxID=67801 RepID=A0A1B0ASG9_9MUSC
MDYVAPSVTFFCLTMTTSHSSALYLTFAEAVTAALISLLLLYQVLFDNLGFCPQTLNSSCVFLDKLGLRADIVVEFAKIHCSEIFMRNETSYACNIYDKNVYGVFCGLTDSVLAYMLQTCNFETNTTIVMSKRPNLPSVFIVFSFLIIFFFIFVSHYNASSADDFDITAAGGNVDVNVFVMIMIPGNGRESGIGAGVT